MLLKKNRKKGHVPPSHLLAVKPCTKQAVS